MKGTAQTSSIQSGRAVFISSIISAAFEELINMKFNNGPEGGTSCTCSGRLSGGSGAAGQVLAERREAVRQRTSAGLVWVDSLGPASLLALAALAAAALAWGRGPSLAFRLLRLLRWPLPKP